jgi:hypothetical protein
MYSPLTVGSSLCLCSSVVYLSVYVDLMNVMLLFLFMNHIMFSLAKQSLTECKIKCVAVIFQLSREVTFMCPAFS